MPARNHAQILLKVLWEQYGRKVTCKKKYWVKSPSSVERRIQLSLCGKMKPIDCYLLERRSCCASLLYPESTVIKSLVEMLPIYVYNSCTEIDIEVCLQDYEFVEAIFNLRAIRKTERLIKHL